MPHIHRPEAESSEKLAALGANSKPTLGQGQQGPRSPRNQRAAWLGRGGGDRAGGPGANQGVLSDQLEEKHHPSGQLSQWCPEGQIGSSSSQKGEKIAKREKDRVGTSPRRHKRWPLTPHFPLSPKGTPRRGRQVGRAGLGASEGSPEPSLPGLPIWSGSRIQPSDYDWTVWNDVTVRM